VTARLLELARRLVEGCPPELGREVAATGSVGSGLADKYSDLELLFLVEEPPAQAQVRTWLETVGATDILVGAEDSDVWAWARLEGVELDPYWGRLARAEAEVDAIVAGRAIAHDRLALAYVLTHCVPLRTEGAVELLANRLVYPDILPRLLIEDAVSGWQIPSAERGSARRNDRLRVESRLVYDAQHLLRIVFALNRRWEPPRWKWLAHHIEGLSLAPPRLEERLVRALLEPDSVAAMRSMLELARDVLALVPPEFDVDAARRGIAGRLAFL